MQEISLPLLSHPLDSHLLFIVGFLMLLAGAAGLFRAGTSLFSMLRWMCVLDIAWMTLGFAFGGADGSTGAVLMACYAGAARGLAWLCLLRLTERAGGDERKGLLGVGKAMPLTAALFAFSMFAALGISPFLTPDPKPLILHSALACSYWIAPALMVFSSALMAVRTVQAAHGVWLGSGAFAHEDEPLLAPGNLPLLALAAIVALLGVFGHEAMIAVASFMGQSALALPDLGAQWHPAAFVAYAGAFAIWLLWRVNAQAARITAVVLAGLSLLFAVLMPAADPLGRLFCMVVTGIGFLVALYSYGYVHKPEGGGPWAESRYYFFLLLLFGSLAGVATSQSLGSLFVFWEIMTLGSYVLVSYENTRAAHAAAIKYFVMCTVAAAFLLPGLLVLSVQFGSLDTATISGASLALGPAAACVIALLALVGYGVKAGLVPGHSWLPDAHPAAPSSISAPLSGVLTKAGVFGLAQLLFGVLGVSAFLSGSPGGGGQIPPVGVLVTALGALTMVYGEIMALMQKDVKRLLAYSTMGQVGEITLTLGLFTWLAAAGALMHVVNHAVMKDLLFFASGALILRAGSRELSDLNGLGRVMPFTAACMVVGLLSILGLPPFAGFMSKFMMLYAIADQAPLLAGLMLLASLAGCVYYTRIIRALIFEPLPAHRRGIKEAPLSMRVSMGVLTLLCVLLGLFPQMSLALVMPVVEGFAASGKLTVQLMPSLQIHWPVFTLFLAAASFVPVLLRHDPRRAGQAAALCLASAAALVALTGQGLDSLSFWFAFLVPAIGAVNMHYATGYMDHSHSQWRFYAFFLCMCAGLTGVAASKDLFNFFLFWEIMSSWSLYFVIVHEENADALREGFKYFFFNVLGAAFLFLAVVLLVNWCGGAGFDAIKERLPMLSAGQIGGALFLMATGFVMKAAQLPFRIDIQMHPATAPTPVSGYISSVLLKSALFGLLKLFLVLGGGLAAVEAASWFGRPEIMTLTLWIGGVTIVMAATFAVFQKDIKLVLIYSTVSQLGYMVVGVALGTSLGVAGGLLHLVNHMFFKDLLFLVAGSVIYSTHRQDMDRMGGLAAKMPITLAFFAIGALCVIGVPPSNGFTSKWIIYHALMEEGHVLLAILSLAGSVITLAYFAKVLHTVFLGQPTQGLEHVCESPRCMLIPMGVLAAGCVLTSVFPGLILAPVNSVLEQCGLAALEVAPWGISSGRGAWNATVASALFAVVIFAGRYTLTRFSVRQRVTSMHTCGVDPDDLNSRTTTRDIYTAPADALKEIRQGLGSLARMLWQGLKQRPGARRDENSPPHGKNGPNAPEA